MKKLFEDLETSKNNIAEVFNKLYFDDQAEYYWLGEILSIGDEFVDLENIKFALSMEIKDNILFKFLEKPRNYNLEDYCLGKAGRKEKRKVSLEKSKKAVKNAWVLLKNEKGVLSWVMKNELDKEIDLHFDKLQHDFEDQARVEYRKVLNQTGFFFEWYPQLTGEWEKDKEEWFDIFKEMEENRNSISTKKAETNKYGNAEDTD